MVIELQFRSITVPLSEMQENYPLIFSALQPYLPVQKPPRRRRPRRKRETLADLIDALIEDIDRGSSG